MAEHDDLDGQVTAGAPAQTRQLEDPGEGEVEKREGHGPVSSSRAIPRKSWSRYPDDILGTHRTEIRRKVLVEGASKRSILRDYGIGHRVLAKILSHPEPLTTRLVGHGRSPSWVSSWASSTMRIPFRSSGPRRPSRSSPRSDVDGWPSNRLSIARYLNVTALGGWHRVTEIGQEFRSSLATRGQIGSDYVQP